MRWLANAACSRRCGARPIISERWTRFGGARCRAADGGRAQPPHGNACNDVADGREVPRAKTALLAPVDGPYHDLGDGEAGGRDSAYEIVRIAVSRPGPLQIQRLE